MVASGCADNAATGQDGDFPGDSDSQSADSDEMEAGETEEDGECIESVAVPNSVDFGAVRGGAENTKEITVSGSRRFTVKSATIFNDDENYEFSIKVDGCAAPAQGACHHAVFDQEVAAGRDFLIVVQYIPRDAQLPDDAVLEIETDDPCRPTKRVDLYSGCKGNHQVVVRLDGEIVSVSAPIVFGPVLPEGQAEPHVVQVANEGREEANAPVFVTFEVDDVFYQNYDFADCAATELAEGFLLGIGESKSCTWRFREKADPGDYAGSLTIQWESSCYGDMEPAQLEADGRVVGCGVEIEPNPTLRFGEAIENHDSIIKSFNLYNACPFAMIWNACDLGKGADFAVAVVGSSSFASSCLNGRHRLEAGASYTLDAKFTPITTDARLDVLTLAFESESGSLTLTETRDLAGNGTPCTYPGCCPPNSDFCQPGTYQCQDPTHRQKCSQDCDWEPYEICEGSTVCTASGCVYSDCVNGQRSCDGPKQLVCQETSWVESGVCDDANECTYDLCTLDQADADGCRFEKLPDGTPCNDGNVITPEDRCLDGECVGAACTCTEVSSCCDGCRPINEGGDCEDGEFCTVGETCQSGVCAGGSPKDCSDEVTITEPQCQEAICNEADYVCEVVAANEGSPCQVGLDVCMEICQSGTCVPSIPNDCGYYECGQSPSGCYDCGECEEGFYCHESRQCNIDCPSGINANLIHETHIGGESFAVYVDDGYVYAGMGRSLHIYTEAGEQSEEVAVIHLADFVRGIFVVDDYAYVADDDSGLAIIDVSNPTNPGQPVYRDTRGSANDVFVTDGYAYVADWFAGLAIIDVSDPTNPGEPVYRFVDTSTSGVYVTGDYAYVSGHSHLAIIDVSDPTNPGEVIYRNTSSQALEVYVEGSYAYMAVISGLAIIDISDPANPGEPIYRDTFGGATGIYITNGYAYLANGFGLTIIDVTDPTNPGEPFLMNTWRGEAWDVYVTGDYAYIADKSAGLAIIDVSDPTHPGEPLYQDKSNDARGVFVTGGYAYVAGYDSSIAIIDVSNPTNPGEPIWQDTSSYIHGVTVAGGYAYVAVWFRGLGIIDVNDPANPGEPVYRDTSGYAYGVYVSGGYAYVADWDSGLAIIDVSDPTNPGQPVYRDTNGGANDVFVTDSYAYVADGSFGLAIIDVSDPTNPGQPVYRVTSDYARGVYVSGGYAYVAAESSGLAIIDVSDPANPGQPVYRETDGAMGVYVTGGYAYVANGDSGLAIIDISDPTNPGQPIYLDTVGRGSGVYVTGGYAYVADEYNGLETFELSCTGGTDGDEDGDYDADLDEEECLPNCAGRECGDDGCGGECGSCGIDEYCNSVGICIPSVYDQMEETVATCSTGANPCGRWRFGKASFAAGVFSLYNSFTATEKNVLWKWYDSTSPESPCVVFNPTDTLITCDPNDECSPPHSVTFHPWYSNLNSVIEWTADHEALYEIEGYFKSVDSGSKWVRIYDMQRIMLLFEQKVSSFQNAPFTLQLRMDVGERIRFAVDYDGSIFNDSTQISAAVRMLAK